MMAGPVIEAGSVTMRRAGVAILLTGGDMGRGVKNMMAGVREKEEENIEDGGNVVKRV